MSFQKYPYTVSLDNCLEDLKSLIKEIRRDWNIENLKMKKMQGGVSNMLFGVFTSKEFVDGETDMILVRVYGKILLDRDLEMLNMSALSKYDLAAKVWGQFENGCCYQFIHGTVLDNSSVWKPEIYTLIINELVKLHTVKLELDRPKTPFVFPKMREMADHLPQFMDNVEKNKKYLSLFPSKERIFREIDELEKELDGLNCPVTFCHNDTLIRNMILNTTGDRIHLIDFEYADYNYCAFDIGNHFNEFAGLDVVDYSLYPDKRFQKIWLRQYLETLRSSNGIHGQSLQSHKSHVDDSEVERWYIMANKFSLASHLLWCIWSIWQEMNSAIEFDYLGYGILRWEQYILKKEEFSVL